MPTITLTPESLAVYAGALLSLLFAYVPGLSTWYAAIDGVKKRLIMAGVLLVVAAAIFGLACTPYASWFGMTLACTLEGALRILPIYFAALVANQSTFLITTASRKRA